MRMLIALALLGCSGSDDSPQKTDSAVIDSALTVDTAIVDTGTIDTAPVDGAALGEPFCSSTIPMNGGDCSSYPAGRVCAFWPFTDAGMDCQTCTCTGGKWSCAPSAMCPFTRETCKGGTSCMSNTGCGAGKCMPFCGCGADGVLHCSANPC